VIGVVEPVAVTPASSAARWTAFAYGVSIALILAHFVLGLPVQVSDSLGDILKLSASWSDLLSAQFTQQGFMRPFHWGSLKLVHDLSGGNYYVWYRGAHVLQVIVLVLLYLALVRPRTWTDAAVLPLGLGVLVGLHTFAGTVREAFPINLYLTVLICCFAAAVVVLGRYRWWNDVLLVTLFVVATLTLETGLLVWVIAVGGWMIGARGISRGGVVALVVLLAGYFYLRFGVLGVGSPGLAERSSGFGFGILEPSELVERFGTRPIVFYGYNVVTSALSVLLSEPTGGVFQVVRALRAGAVSPVMIVNLISSLGATLLIGRYIWTRRRQWQAGLTIRGGVHGATLERDDRLVLLFAAVLAANAVITFPYSKDVIMSPAGGFLAAAVFVAARHLLATAPSAAGTSTRWALVTVAAVLVASTWGLRAAGLHASLRVRAVAERLDWAYLDGNIAHGEVQIPRDARSMTVVRTLQDDALVRHPAPRPLNLPLGRLLGVED